ncbi:isopentenyl phosphate kinase [Methanobacterium formicicum]|uniref:Isopentenyl phosphate kinase n=1 Tax=Methanobacterium formicicum TaxID=2162 RepID=A0A090I163_METFO|nr:isopentenyl phosphate kinase [Methanobacterium formicicum]MDH2659027.1 isopentenyl phosphate kinase [Methanobacterium formicicum]CEA12653.1 aspartate/glutamate/uridylate kinase [Methanobacterium formicicum]
MIILKLGGSVITRKDATKPTLDPVNLDRIAREIAQAQVEKLIIIHGAGSFGHLHASKYAIGSPITTPDQLREKRMGFTLTQNSVKNLNHFVCHYLLNHGIPAVAVPPSSFITSRNKRIESARLEMVEKYLEMGMVPVLYGDVVLDADEDLKMAVISGDQLVSYLSLKLKPERIILGSDVDGIFDRDPKKHPQAQLLERVQSLEDLQFLEGAQTVDVTGGMAGKLAELLELAEKGIESELINVGCEGLLENALKGEKVRGTIIRK